MKVFNVQSFQAIVYLNDVKYLSIYPLIILNLVISQNCIVLKKHTQSSVIAFLNLALHWMAKTWWGTSSEQWMYT